ncbi:nardilysin-like [Zingiber officinale]|uniref:nardilysin-like n=1 Tax=Zingiber officinale TaxID=94328 RepID=UPI001C4CEC15|nr:nardilysin-like [Zingiber officinale]
MCLFCSHLQLYFLVEQDVGIESTRLEVIINLFSKIIEEPFFHQLRTKVQFGYVVDCGPRTIYRVLGYCFRVQSSEYSPIHLHGRIDNFINGLRDLLESLDDKSFESYRSGLMAEKLEKAPSLLYETANYWDEIVNKRFSHKFLHLLHNFAVSSTFHIIATLFLCNLCSSSASTV